MKFFFLIFFYNFVGGLWLKRNMKDTAREEKKNNHQVRVGGTTKEKEKKENRLRSESLNNLLHYQFYSITCPLNQLSLVFYVRMSSEDGFWMSLGEIEKATLYLFPRSHRFDRSEHLTSHPTITHAFHRSSFAAFSEPYRTNYQPTRPASVTNNYFLAGFMLPESSRERFYLYGNVAIVALRCFTRTCDLLEDNSDDLKNLFANTIMTQWAV